MDVLAWIPLGMAAALPASMLLPGKRSRALNFSGLACSAGALLACRLHTGPSGRPGGITRRRDIQEGSLPLTVAGTLPPPAANGSTAS